MSRLVTVNRVVDPVGDLLYRDETATELFRVRVPCSYGNTVDIEFNYDDPKIDKMIITVSNDEYDGYDGWKTAQGQYHTKSETVYEVWFNHAVGYRVTWDEWDVEEYDDYNIYPVYAEDYEPEVEPDAEKEDESEDTKPEDCDTYWSIEKKTIDGKTTYNVTVKAKDDDVKKTDLTYEQFQKVIDSLHSDKVKVALEESVKKDDSKDVSNAHDAHDAHDAYEDYCRKNGIGYDSIWKDFDKIVDSVFRENYNNPTRDFYKDYFLK